MPILQAGKEKAFSATGSTGSNTTRPAWFLPCRSAPVSNRTSRCPLVLRANSLIIARKGRLLNDSENLFRLDGLTRGNFQFLQDPTGGRYDRNFHFHRFHDHDDFIFLHFITDFFFNPQDFAYHGRVDVYCQCSAPFSLTHSCGYVIRVLPFSRVSQSLSMLACLGSRKVLKVERDHSPSRSQIWLRPNRETPMNPRTSSLWPLSMSFTRAR